MTASEELAQSALLEIEAVIRDLHWTAPNGYFRGYELGHMKGVLEHILRTHPDVKTRGAYLQGYLSGYGQGLLYLVRSNALGRPQRPQGYGITTEMTHKAMAVAEGNVTRDAYGQERGSHHENKSTNEDLELRGTNPIAKTTKMN